jgi:hypothetical protein
MYKNMPMHNLLLAKIITLIMIIGQIIVHTHIETADTTNTITSSSSLASRPF